MKHEVCQGQQEASQHRLGETEWICHKVAVQQPHTTLCKNNTRTAGGKELYGLTWVIHHRLPAGSLAAVVDPAPFESTTRNYNGNKGSFMRVEEKNSKFPSVFKISKKAINDRSHSWNTAMGSTAAEKKASTFP